MLKKRFFFLVGILLLLLMLSFLGYRMFSRTHQSVAAQESLESIRADSLYTGYMRDEPGADKKYLGKVVEVTGVISAKSQNDGESPVWTLSYPETSGAVNCRMFQTSPDRIDPKLGDTISIKGKCTGFLADVNLVDCVPEDKK